MTDIDNMGKVNLKYGVCGFTSSLYALYNHSPANRKYLAAAGKMKLRIAAEIKTFLEILRSEDSALLGEIEEFTRTFKGYGGFTVAEYIRQINTMTKSNAQAAAVDISIALPPKAVVKYLRDICNLRNARIVDANASPEEAVIGVTKGDPLMKKYGGLCHYVYKQGTTIYSWGNQYSNLAAANASYSPCVMISLSG